MIIEVLRYRIPQEDSEAFEQAAAALDGLPEILDFKLSRSAIEPGAYILRVAWASAGTRLEGFKPYLSEVSPYFGSAVQSLYEWAGGSEAFERLTSVFYDNVLKDDVVGPLFAGMDPSHPKYVAMWLAEVFGGPANYTTERGGYSSMVGHHLGKAITEQQRRRWISLLMDAADEAGLPDDPEFRAAFAAYIEWGTRIALSNSQPGAEPPSQAPVPHWGWGVAPPFTPGG